MFWLRSSICQVLPPLSERYSAFNGNAASRNAYTTSGFDGATATATRPHGFGGNPDALAAVSSVQVAPPSVRSEERRVGKEWKTRRSAGDETKNNTMRGLVENGSY